MSKTPGRQSTSGPTAGIAASPLRTQVGGDHYKAMPIQPIEFAMVNGLNACQSKVIKYVTRAKAGKAKRIEDLAKAKHVIDIWIELIEAGKVEA